jgi:Holliday junction resolvasome RuvABC endonuclease subunit
MAYEDTDKILALDVSGTCTGWAYGVYGKLEDYGKYIQKQSGSKGKKLAQFADWLTSLLEAKKPTVILIEKPYRGRNSNVLANLSKFIAVVELCAYLTLDLELEESWFLDPRTIKRLLKVQKGQDYDDNKRIMVNRINSLFGLKLKYSSKKSKKLTDDDIADAIAILVAHWSRDDNDT